MAPMRWHTPTHCAGTDALQFQGIMFSTLTLFGTLACVSLAVTIWQVCVGFRFPLGRRTGDGGYVPSVTILKPLKGCDSETEGCLRSWLTQDYAGSLQIIFGVA